MVRVKPLLWGVLLTGVWLLCTSDVAPDPYGGWVPYFMERSELEHSVFYADGPREMENPGKIWVDDTRIWIVERYKGVHIIDNTNPSNPVRSRFIVAPGCMDIAVKGGIIYLDNAVDLVAFHMAAGIETGRLKNYFVEPVCPNGRVYHNKNTDMILVGWKQTAEKVETEGRP